MADFMIPKNKVTDNLGSSYTHGTDSSMTLTDASDFPGSSEGGGIVMVREEGVWALLRYSSVSTNTLENLTSPDSVNESSSADGHTFEAGAEVRLVVAADYVREVLEVLQGNKTYPANQNLGNNSVVNMLAIVSSAQSSTPASSSAGDFYVDDGTNTASGKPAVRMYSGSAWQDLARVVDLFSGSHDDLTDVSANDHIDNLTDIPTRNHNDLSSISAGDHRTDEEIQDLVNTLMQAGDKMSWNYDDSGNTLTVNTTALDDELYLTADHSSDLCSIRIVEPVLNLEDRIKQLFKMLKQGPLKLDEEYNQTVFYIRSFSLPLTIWGTFGLKGGDGVSLPVYDEGKLEVLVFRSIINTLAEED